MPQLEPCRIAVLISGGGTTLRNLIERHRNGKLMANMVLVVSSNPQAGGLEFARAAGIPSRTVSHRDYSRVDDFSQAIFDACRAARVELVVLGGFLRRLKIPADFANRVINIHPSLLPAFGGKGYYGLRVHEAVLKAGCDVTGCTVHYVDDQFDHGPIIDQATVRVEADDTAESLAARVFARECELYPDVINNLAQMRMR